MCKLNSLQTQQRMRSVNTPVLFKYNWLLMQTFICSFSLSVAILCYFFFLLLQNNFSARFLHVNLINLFISAPFQKQPSKLSYFRYDCILSALTDFIALSIFIHQYLFYRKGLEFIVVYGCLLLINLTFLASIKVITSHLQQDLIAQHNLHDIMWTTSDLNASESFDNWTRTIDKPKVSNYTFQHVIDEINSIYRYDSWWNFRHFFFLSTIMIGHAANI